jgi:hypothetical protein
VTVCSGQTALEGEDSEGRSRRPRLRYFLWLNSRLKPRYPDNGAPKSGAGGQESANFPGLTVAPARTALKGWDSEGKSRAPEAGTFGGLTVGLRCAILENGETKPGAGDPEPGYFPGLTVAPGRTALKGGGSEGKSRAPEPVLSGA